MTNNYGVKLNRIFSKTNFLLIFWKAIRVIGKIIATSDTPN